MPTSEQVRQILTAESHAIEHLVAVQKPPNAHRPPAPMPTIRPGIPPMAKPTAASTPRHSVATTAAIIGVHPYNLFFGHTPNATFSRVE